MAGNSNVIWTIWCEQSITSSSSSPNITYYPSEVIWHNWTQADIERLNEEQRRVAEEGQREAEQRAALRKAAQERAKLLLVANLKEDQRRDLDTKRHFIVHSKSGERRYRIRQGRTGNVDLLNAAGAVVAKFCIHPAVLCPDEDTMLAQKLMIETDEDGFLLTANKTVVITEAA